MEVELRDTAGRCFLTSCLVYIVALKLTYNRGVEFSINDLNGYLNFKTIKS
jgi:hypothetical protein